MVAAITADAPTPNDVVIAVFGASAGAGGLVLVFLGVLVTTLGTYPGATSDEVLRPYRNGAWAAVGVFVGSLATAAASVAWLAICDAHWLYVTTLSMFVALLVALGGLAVGVTRATT